MNRECNNGHVPRTCAAGLAAARRLFVAALVFASPSVAFAADYQVGQVIVYDNPNDDVPPRKGRVTKLTGDQVWVNFGEFDASLNAGDASKILFKGTSELDDWTRPDGPGKGANVAPDANTPAPTVAPGAAPDQAAVNVADAGTLASLFGLWGTLQIGHTVIIAPGDGYIYQKQEIADKAGAIAINPDGTYLWNSVSEGVIKGTWREASAAEVKGGYDGPGIRLIHAEGGWDYNVQLRPQTGTQDAASISIWTQGYQVNAYRME